MKVVEGRKTGSAYWENMSLKVNAKFGGVNHGLLTMFKGQPEKIVFLGADVHHPDPGAKGVPSIAAVISSMDPRASDWYSLVREQEHRVEQVSLCSISQTLDRVLCFFFLFRCS
jgi:eukaryotic translation initiation factor 2C